MPIQYTPAPLDILSILGCTENRGGPHLKEFESAHHVKLPPLLFDFFSAAWGHPLFQTSDIWTTGRPCFHFSYESLEETIADWQEDWEEDPECYADDFCFRLSRVPKEQWPEHVPDYLEIGSDYSAGVVTFGIRRTDLDQPDPPVYILHEGAPETDWKVIDDTLSLFLMRVLADTLACAMYDTAKRVLEQAGWRYSKTQSMSEALEWAAELGIDLSKAARCGALYAAAVTPDVCRYCYIEEKNLLFILKDDAGNQETTCAVLTKR